MDLIFRCCHCCLSKNNGCSFQCVVTGHLISSGWIFICCQCCFTLQWMWFSTCCHCPLSKSSGFHFLYVITAHLRGGWFSICYHFSARSNVCDFPHVVIALFQRSKDFVFHVLHRTFNKQLMDFHML